LTALVPTSAESYPFKYKGSGPGIN